MNSRWFLVFRAVPGSQAQKWVGPHLTLGFSQWKSRCLSEHGLISALRWCQALDGILIDGLMRVESGWAGCLTLFDDQQQYWIIHSSSNTYRRDMYSAPKFIVWRGRFNGTDSKGQKRTLGILLLIHLGGIKHKLVAGHSTATHANCIHLKCFNTPVVF